MFDAMSSSALGDDSRHDCETTMKLERQVADLFGKEASLLVPSGIMANNLNLKLMAGLSGESVILGSNSHIINNERGGVSSFASIMPWIVANNPDGTMDLAKVKRMAGMASNEHIVPIKGISLESSHNGCNGRVLRPDYISQVKKIAKKAKAKMHLDGARSWNAATYLGLDMKEMLKDFDLISVCLSKGLGCPIGSLVVGSAKDIAQARIYRKMIGGTMRQTGIFAACGLVALEDW
jgi:threonine aldolase